MAKVEQRHMDLAREALAESRIEPRTKKIREPLLIAPVAQAIADAEWRERMICVRFLRRCSQGDGDDLHMAANALEFELDGESQQRWWGSLPEEKRQEIERHGRTLGKRIRARAHLEEQGK